MAAKNNTELIQDLTRELRQLAEQFSVQSTVTDRELRQHKEELAGNSSEIEKSGFEIANLRGRVIAVEERCSHYDRFNPERVAFLEQRCSYLEKLVHEIRMRRWQVWLAVLAAILSAVIALIVALVKK